MRKVINGTIGKGMDCLSKAILTREAMISKEPENANREVCFLIEKNAVYLEKVLVDFNGAPIFFLCQDQQGRYYITLCYDTEDWKYLVVRTSDVSVFHLLHQESTIRKTILEQPQYWLVTAGETPAEDLVELHKIADIHTEILPEEGIYLQILTKEMQEYVECFDKVFRDRWLRNSQLLDH